MDLQTLKSLKWSKKNIKPNPEEIFRFMSLQWDIESMLKRAEQLNLPLREVNPSAFKGFFGIIGIDKEYALSSTKQDPLLLIEIKPGEHMLADGYHRAYRDSSNGVENYPAIIVPFEEQIKYLLDKSMFDSVIRMAKQKLSK